VLAVALATPSGAAGQDQPPSGGALPAMLCAEREPCRVTTLHKAGVGAKGQRLVVAQVALHEEPEVELEPPPEGTSDGEASAATPAAADEPPALAAPRPERCLPYEYWLLRYSGPELLAHQLLLTACADAQAEPPPGATEEVSVGDNSFTHVTRAPEPPDWRVERSLKLSPLGLLLERERRTLGSEHHRVDRSLPWQRLGGSLLWSVPTCGRRRRPDPAAEPVRNAALLIPLVPLPDSLLETGWSTTSLGRCAATLDGTPKRGFLLQGEVSSERDARLRLLLGSERVLLIELRDDHWSGAQRGGEEDRLELWLGPATDHRAPCLSSDRKKPVGWSVGVADARVTPLGTTPGAPPSVRRQAVVVRDGGIKVRLHVTLPRPVGGLTVVYRDHDPDGSHELSTSSLRRDDVASLGAVRRIEPEQARCQLRRDVLQLRVPHRYEPGAAALRPLP